MILDGLFDMLNDRNRRKRKQLTEEYFRQKAELLQKLYEHEKNRPKYQPGKGTYFGEKIYGSDPNDWVQTIPPPLKSFHPEKGNWMAIPHYLEDVKKCETLQTIEILL